MKVNDVVKVNRGEHRGWLGKVKQVSIHNLQYTQFTLCKVEFESNVFEWINKMYLVKV